MKLFLASSLDKTIKLLSEKIPTSSRKVLFVANAADTSDDPWWVDLDRKAFEGLGFKITDIDLRTVSRGELNKSLGANDIIHLCGGSVFYLLSLLNKDGLGDLIADHVKMGKIILSGTSAGSIVPAPLLSIYKYDTEEVKFFKNEAEAKGLGLVNFIILPHCNNPEFAENNKNVVEHAHEVPFPLLLLQDNQVVWVEDSKLEILSA